MQKKSILIIDNNTANINYLVDILKNKFELKVAFDGLMGINIIYDNFPSLVILSVDMPKIEGFMVSEVLKNDSKTKNIPIIFLDEKHIKKDQKVKAQTKDYIVKPFIENDIFTKISKYI